MLGPNDAGIPVQNSPVNAARLQECLFYHPDPALVSYLLTGFTQGFDIGYSGPITPGVLKNSKSATDNSDHVSETLQKELDRGHIMGPFNSLPIPNLHISPLGSRPKKDGSLRLIMDLSSPRGSSINEGIDREEFSVSYTSFDDAVDMIIHLGNNSFMGKIDIKHAYRLCPVREQDFPLLGIMWQGLYYVDTRLPMGCRSSAYIFNTFADTLLWIISTICAISFVVHYLDDFFIASQSKEECKYKMEVILSLFNFLGVPVDPKKIEGPAQIIVYLGIEIDTVLRIIRLPLNKVAELDAILIKFLSLRSCTKRELLSLIGKLSFAAKVLKPGRLFLRYLIDLSTSVRELHHFVHIPKHVHDDLRWWRQALQKSNASSYFQDTFISSVDLCMFTDASGKHGLGGYFGSLWFSQEWPLKYQRHGINVKELLAVITAFELWIGQFADKQIKIYTDNENICNLWRNRSVKDLVLLKLIRHLFLRAISVNCNVMLVHVPGHYNAIADHLSRLQVRRARQLAPFLEEEPCEVPSIVWRILDA